MEEEHLTTKQTISKEIIKKSIDKMKKLHLENGSKDDYGLGFYNGMELIKAILLGIEPEYLSIKELKGKAIQGMAQEIMETIEVAMPEIKGKYKLEFMPISAKKIEEKQKNSMEEFLKEHPYLKKELKL